MGEVSAIVQAYCLKGRTAGGLAASALHGLWRQEAFPQVVENYRPGARRTQSSTDRFDVHLSSALPAKHRTRVRGWAATTVDRTVIDIYRRHGFRAAYLAAVSAVQQQLTGDLFLLECLEECRQLGLRGMAGFERLVAAIDTRVDSALEAIFHAQVLERAEIRVRPQAKFRARGRTYFVDFLVEGTLIAIELDGKGKYGQGEEQQFQLAREKRRADDLVSYHGVRLLRFGYAEVVSGQAYEEVAARLRLRSGRSGGAGAGARA